MHELCLERVLPADAAGDGYLCASHVRTLPVPMELGAGGLPQRDTSKGFGRVNCVIAGLPASLQGNTLRVAACLLGCTRAASSSVLVCGTQAAASCSRAVTASRSSSQAASSDSALLSTCWQGPLRTRS